MEAVDRRDVEPLTDEQATLQAQLVGALRRAWPASASVGQALDRADHSYREVAEALVALRHAFRSQDGQPDLKGRSYGYRTTVREAYSSAGAEVSGPIEKRLTAGVSYWVRRLLLERYGEGPLRSMGVLPRTQDLAVPYSSILKHLPKDPSECLSAVVGVLNRLAADPGVVPTEDTLRSAIRAISLLQSRARACISDVA